MMMTAHAEKIGFPDILVMNWIKSLQELELIKYTDIVSLPVLLMVILGGK